MRRLLVLALLLLPSAAWADEWPPFYGCSATGCYQVTLTPDTFSPGADRYLYTITCTSTSSVCGDWLFERVTLYDAHGNPVYSRGGGNTPVTLSGTPVTGTLGFSTYDPGGQSVTGHSVPLTTVPEPITMALVGTGLVAIGMARRRRRAIA